MTAPYSVVIPAFNAERTIGEAIASVTGQTAPPETIFVVDDGSTDATASAAAAGGPLVTVIRKDNGGPGSATTAGLRAATSEFVATLDSDDLWLPGKMERQLAVLSADPGLSGAFSLARLFRDGEPANEHGPGAVRRLWTRTTMVYRTADARIIGDMTDFPGYIGEFIDWVSRGRDLGQRVTMVEDVLAMRRIRPGSLSYGAEEERRKGYLHAVRNALARRQAPDGNQG